MDRVKLEGLAVEASVGVYEFEHAIRQRLEIDVTAHMDLSEAGRTDALAAGLDYDRIAACCREVVASRHHQLIETIAESIAARVLAIDARVQRAEVRVAKPGAVPDARTVAVEIGRDRT
jgi:dihydroneopterin aldolase